MLSERTRISAAISGRRRGSIITHFRRVGLKMAQFENSGSCDVSELTPSRISDECSSKIAFFILYSYPV